MLRAGTDRPRRGGITPVVAGAILVFEGDKILVLGWPHLTQSISLALSDLSLVLETISKSRLGSPEGLAPLARGLGDVPPEAEDPVGGWVGMRRLPF